MLNTILLETKKSALENLAPLALILIVFFFFMIWPQMRKQKKAKNYLTSLKKGDKIVTTGGVHGKISQIADTHFIIDLEEGQMKVERGAVSMEMTAAAYGKQSEPAVEKN